MKFRFVKKVTGKVIGYDGQKVATGDEVTLNGHFAEKARNNPDYELVDESRSVRKRAKKKVTRRG